MNRDSSKVCWYCKQPTMKKVEDHYQCSACGATWNKVPKLLPAPLLEPEVIRGRGGRILGHKNRPRAIRH